MFLLITRWVSVFLMNMYMHVQRRLGCQTPVAMQLKTDFTTVKDNMNHNLPQSLLSSGQFEAFYLNSKYHSARTCHCLSLKQQLKLPCHWSLLASDLYKFAQVLIFPNTVYRVQLITLQFIADWYSNRRGCSRRAAHSPLHATQEVILEYRIVLNCIRQRSKTCLFLFLIVIAS